MAGKPVQNCRPVKSSEVGPSVGWPPMLALLARGQSAAESRKRARRDVSNARRMDSSATAKAMVTRKTRANQPPQRDSRDIPMSNTDSIIASSRSLASAVSACLRDGSPKPTQLPPVRLDLSDEVAACERPVCNARRPKLWQIAGKFHCSLLGVCLELDEMQRLAQKLDIRESASLTEYELHHWLVHLAGHSDKSGRRLHRHLENKFAAATRQLRNVRDSDELLDAWICGQETEELGGLYWAVLTHPAVNDSIADRALGEVHMLSHVAATDLRKQHRENDRLADRVAGLEVALERARGNNARQLSKLEAAQREVAEHDDVLNQLHAAQARARTLEQLLAKRSVTGAKACASQTELEAITQRLKTSEADSRHWRALYRRNEKQLRKLKGVMTPGDDGELVAGPDYDASKLRAEQTTSQRDLTGWTIGYVGGLTRLLPRFRDITEQRNGRLLHHDGGLEERPRLLEELLSRADCLVVPVGCVSHSATNRLKRRARQAGKPVLWIRTASVSAYAKALDSIPVDVTSIGGRPDQKPLSIAP